MNASYDELKTYSFIEFSLKPSLIDKYVVFCLIDVIFEGVVANSKG